MVQRSTKFTGICIAIYMVYAIFVFFVLPMLLPDPVTMTRAVLEAQTRHLGNLTNATLEAGGQPKRSLLVTFRGSGAIKLLDYFSRQPGCYHHFSPLIAYRHRITDKSQIVNALDELDALFNCDYNRSLPMLDLGMRTTTFRNFYGVQHRTCFTYSSEVCSKPETLAQICRLFPFLNMSVYNLSLRYLMNLLKLKDSNVRIVLLVRDPRATMTSRSNRVWCNTLDCVRPDDLCSNMVDDYEVAQRLLHEYPDRFEIVRYEELALNPEVGLKSVFDFYGLPMKSVDGNHTEPNNQMYFEEPLQWQKFLSLEDITKIQDTCKTAMKLWGYHSIKYVNKQLANTFEPLHKLPLFSN